MEKFISLKDTAVIIRQELKAKLPLTKYSVRIKSNKSQDLYKPNNEIFVSLPSVMTI